MSFLNALRRPTAGERSGYSNYSYWGSTLRAFRKNKAAMFFLWLLLILLLFTFIQPLLPGQRDPNLINNDPETGFMLKNQQPSSTFWFGTNAIGQDLWSRLWSGTRTSLFIGVVVAFFEALIGIVMGALWGYVRKLDRLFTEIYNVIDNIPTTIIRMLFAYMLRPSLFTVTFVMCLTGWFSMARFIRNQIVITATENITLLPVVWARVRSASSRAISCPTWFPSSCCAWRWLFPERLARRSF